jgi:hypothetical protein
MEARRVVAQVFDKAVAVGVVRLDAAVGAKYERVGGAEAPRQRVGRIGELERRLLVRHGQVDAGEAELGQGTQRGFEIFGAYRQRHVGAVDLVVRQPVAVQARGERMGDRPAHHPGQTRSPRDGAHGATPCSRK